MILESGVGYSSQCYWDIIAGKKRVLGLVIFDCQSSAVRLMARSRALISSLPFG